MTDIGANSPLDLQTSRGPPLPSSLDVGTSLVVPPPTVMDRLAHFPEEVWDLSPTSHLVRLMSVLVGDAGLSALNKRIVLARLQSSLQGTHFYDLDRFYGSLFGIRRLTTERYTIDPQGDIATPAEWDEVRAKDGSYRSRIEQFAQAIQWGATAIGIELAAEAVLNVDCDVIEQTPWAFTVVPKRLITESERYDLKRVLSRLKPLNSLMTIDADGVASYESVSVHGVKADSEHWEVRASLPDGLGGSAPASIPPFSGAQGDEISWAGDIESVLSYATEPNGNQVSPYFQRLYVPVQSNTDGFVDYSPEKGLLAYDVWLSWRVVSDGNLVSHPYDGPRAAPGRFTSVGFDGNVTHGLIREPSGTTPLFHYGTKVVEGRRGRGRLTSPGYNPGPIVLPEPPDPVEWSGERFWSTEERWSFDTTEECLEVRFSSPKPLNFVELGLPHFPHDANIEVWDDRTNSWLLVYKVRIRDSYPSLIPDRVSSNHWHPQHGWAGHWVGCQASFDQITTRAVRLRSQRSLDGTPPVGSSGDPIAYSLGALKLNLGLRVESPDDIGYDPNFPDSQEIGTAPTVVGDITYRIDKYPAANAITDGLEWMSAPQPDPRCVVPFYVDLRDAANDPQVFERLRLSTSRPGSTLRLYWSNDLPNVAFAPDDGPIEVTPHGTPTVEGGGIRLNAPGEYLGVDPQSIRFRGDQGPWWAGFSVQPTFDDTVNIADTPHIGAVGSLAGITVAFDNGGVGINLSPAALGDFGLDLVDTIATLAYQAHHIIAIVLDWNPDVGLSLHVTNATTGESNSSTLTLEDLGEGSRVENTDEIRLGAFGESVLAHYGIVVGDFAANHLLRSFVLKAGVLDEAGHQRFLSSPTDFSTYDPAHDDGHLDNAVLRFHPDYINPDVNPYGLVGGTGNFFPRLTWTPIPREYTLQSGYLHFPSTRARFLKLEITNLLPELYERRNRVAEQALVYPFRWVRTTDVGGGGGGGNAHVWDVYPGMTATWDAGWESAIVPTEPADLPTAGLYSTDPAVRTHLGSVGSLYGAVDPHLDSNMPMWDSDAVHTYESVSLLPKGKMAWFTSIGGIEVSRLVFESPDNPVALSDRYHDLSHVAETNFAFEPGVLDSATRPTAFATSTTWPSSTEVQGVQFASVQSDAVQLVTDDTFSDPHLAIRDWSDESGWHSVGDASLRWLRTASGVAMSRTLTGDSLLAGRDSEIEQRPIQPVFAFRDPSSPGAPGFGGIESATVIGSPRGQLHGAIRFTALTDLSNPLRLQIVTASGTLLAEKVIYAKAGQTVEETCSYVIGSSASEEEVVTAEYRGLDNPVHPVFAGYDPLAVTAAPGEESGNLYRIKVIQEGASDDEVVVKALSLFNDSILWEFTNDGVIWVPAYVGRNDPHGVVRFPELGTDLAYRVTAYRQALFVSSIKLRPWYFNTMPRVSVDSKGGNRSHYDQEPPIEQDPEWEQWSNPVPRWWWMEGQRYPTEGSPMGFPSVGPYRVSTSVDVAEEATPVDDVVTTHASRRRSVTEAAEFTDEVTTSSAFSRTIGEDPGAPSDAVTSE